MRKLMFFAMYFGMGALLHAAFIGVIFNPASVMSWAWLLAWPVPFGILGIGLAIGVSIVAMLIIGAWSGVESALRRGKLIH